MVWKPGKKTLINSGGRSPASLNKDQQQLAAALAESDSQKAAFFETALDAIISMDEAGKVLEFNPAAVRMFGYKLNEAIGRELAALIIPPEFRERHRAGLEHYLKGGPGPLLDNRTVLSAVRRDGSEFPIELTITEVNHRGARTFTGTIRDISERVNAEKVQARVQDQLKEDEARQAFLLELSDNLRGARSEAEVERNAIRLLAKYMGVDRCFIARVRPKKGQLQIGSENHKPGLVPVAGEYRLTDISGIIELAGAGPLVVRDRKIDTRLSGKDQRWLLKMKMEAVLAAGIHLEESGLTWLLVAGSSQPREWSSQEIKAIQEVAERTWSSIERTSARAALAASEKRFRSLIDQSTDVIQLLDANVNLFYSSDSVKKVTGFSPAEIEGHNARDHVHPDDWPAFQEKLQKLLKNPREPQTLEYRIRSKSGDWIWVETTGTNHLKTPNINALVGNFRDITDRRKAQDELRDSENRFRALIENSSDGIAVFDALGKLTFVSPAVANILGYSPEELLKFKDLGALTHPDDVDYLTKRFEKITKPGELLSATYRARAKSGEYRWVEVFIKNALKDPAVRGYIVNYRNVTENKQAQENLAASEQRYRFLADNSSDIITMIDESGAIHYQSPSLRRVLGDWPKREGANIFNSPLVHPDDAAAKTKFIRKLIDGGPGTYGRSEFRMYRKNEGWRDLEVIGYNLTDEPGVGGVMLTSRDVTARKAAQSALVASEARLRQAQRAGNIGVFEWDMSADNIIFSSQAELILGYEPGAFKNKTYKQSVALIYPADREGTRNEAQTAIKDHQELNLEYRIIRADNKEERWLNVRGDTSYDAAGRPTRMIGVIIDVTERKRLEQQKDEFIAVTSHELRTPVTSMKVYAQALERRLKKGHDEVATTMVERIDGQLDRLNNLVRDLLDVTRIDTGQRLTLRTSHFSYLDLVQETIAAISLTASNHKIRLGSKLDCELVSDRDRLAQILTNLIDNAIKYSPDKPNVTVSITKKDSSVVTCVADQGIGISQSEQRQLFERFARVGGEHTAGFPGLGLGLYITAQIVDRLGGKIWVDSRLGKGSKFYFSLPLAKSAK